ncbi:DUF4377 domain-containing protein [Spirosoma linguale]|uniref:DUF4377 domain-containing protein n=1 Tax=Spirosoma linguale (strain ATCC 33905 / DSM 74 / LMG 10896 / Claus 1) TaxID=504472 RepID=D2QBX9_SPILD|nr:conserved hypothetical protein [Spirosoma linguale DSM 74]
MVIRRVFTVVLLLLAMACETSSSVDVSPEPIILQVDNRQQDCSAGVLQRKCLWVKEEDAASWQLFYYDIDGFTYEPGYRYRLEVKREMLAVEGLMDALPYKYTLIRVVDKVKQ